MSNGVEFTAACPCGHPDAAWLTFLQEVPGGPGSDYLSEQLPTYRVECAWCAAAPVGDTTQAPDTQASDGRKA